jgi:hypothetical protein
MDQKTQKANVLNQKQLNAHIFNIFIGHLLQNRVYIKKVDTTYCTNLIVVIG